MADIKRALSIAGTDPSSGAGIQADLKTFQAHGVYGLTVVTAVTAQNTQHVRSVQEIAPEIVQDQILCLFEDMSIQAIKIGMVFSPQVIQAIADAFQRIETPCIVMDPVMISESGYDLLQKEAHDLLVTALFPRADVLTPNIHEAERLTGQSIQTIEDMKTAARQLLKMGPSHVVVKGGHATKTPGVDILATGQDVVTLSPRVVSAANFHGTGCTFSSAIAANIAMGSPVEQAVKKAKEYISLTIERAFHIGRGHPVLGHFPDTGH